MKSYRAVMLTKKGGPEVLRVVELPLEEPGPGQLRVRVGATGVGSTDLTMLEGSYPFAPKIPFVPGYEVAGVVDAVGAGVSGFHVGQRVAALTVWGGYAEYLLREAEHFLPIPDAVSDADAAVLGVPGKDHGPAAPPGDGLLGAYLGLVGAAGEGESPVPVPLGLLDHVGPGPAPGRGDAQRAVAAVDLGRAARSTAGLVHGCGAAARRSAGQ